MVDGCFLFLDLFVLLENHRRRNPSQFVEDKIIGDVRAPAGNVGFCDLLCRAFL